MTTRWRLLGRLAWRESRTARRRLLLYMSSISLGVAALVAIDSFSGNVTRSIREQSRALLGGDLSWSSRQRFPASIDSLIDSLRVTGAPSARVTTFASMGVVPRTAGTRLVQVRAVSAGYPFYGEITTEPAGLWARLHDNANAMVDPTLLIALDAQIGDTLVLGFGRFRILGTLKNVPGDPGLAAVIGPRVYIPERFLPETQLLVFGSRAEYEVLFRVPEEVSPGKFVARLRPRLEAARIRARTVTENEMNLTEAIERMGDFLGIVGLVALLLGGIGVASGVHAFVAHKIDTVAILRCLGATSGQVLVVYVTQAAVMGLLGAAAGALLGIGIQFLLPHVIADFIPVDVAVRLEPAALGLGLLVGGWVALVFALRPLLALRSVSPLQALRRDADSTVLRMRWRDWPRLLVNVALVGSVLAIAVARIGALRDGAIMTLSIGVAIGILAASASLLSAVARRMLRRGWPYVVRQGVANLYRPANQTRAVVLALGFGTFLVTTLYQVQSNLVREFTIKTSASSGNLLFFDVQDDQALALDSMVRAAGHAVVQRTPIVTMRIASINGRATEALLKDSARATWPLRREYRSTYRDSMVHTETLAGGRWFRALGARRDSLGEVSVERDVARELRLRIGDLVTWDVQGVPVPTRVTSFREVDWARFEPNFFVVFSPDALTQAPRQFVLLTKVPDDLATARLQRRVVDRFPNVSSIDLSLIQGTLSGILRRVSVAVRFLALFSLAMGVPVLFSAVAATRRARVREGVLLKTLGATRRQIERILLAEYLLLGALGSMTGILLSFAAAWALMRWEFESAFVPAFPPAVLIGGLFMALTVVIGALSGRDVFRETPMAALREG